MDETYIGGQEPGLAGGRAKGKRVLTGIAVEAHAEGGLGRCRMAPIENAKAATLRAFIQNNVAPGSLIDTDGWGGYRSIARKRVIGLVRETDDRALVSVLAQVVAEA